MENVIVQFNFPGVTAEQYDGTWADLRKMGIENPDGLMSHIGGFTKNGLVVTDVWESASKFEAFGPTLIPILKKNGFPDVAPSIAPLHYKYKAALVH